MRLEKAGRWISTTFGVSNNIRKLIIKGLSDSLLNMKSCMVHNVDRNDVKELLVKGIYAQSLTNAVRSIKNTMIKYNLHFKN